MFELQTRSRSLGDQLSQLNRDKSLLVSCLRFCVRLFFIFYCYIYCVSFRLFFVVFLFVISFLFLNAYVFSSFFLSFFFCLFHSQETNVSSQGQEKDQLIKTISDQREELRDQKEQLKNTRSELDDLRAQLEKERKARVCVCLFFCCFFFFACVCAYVFVCESVASRRNNGRTHTVSLKTRAQLEKERKASCVSVFACVWA